MVANEGSDLDRRSPDHLPRLLSVISSDSQFSFDTCEVNVGDSLHAMPSGTSESYPAKIYDEAEWNQHQESISRPPIEAKPGTVFPDHVSISMPNSPAKFQGKKVAFQAQDDDKDTPKEQTQSNGSSLNSKCQKRTKYYSQPMPSGHAYAEAMASIANSGTQFTANSAVSRSDRYDKYAYFKTRSAKLERQISRLRGKPQEADHSGENRGENEPEAVPAGRFFDALEGPELEILRDSEELVLPTDKLWPFLLRFPISCFGIGLGVASQAILWKNLAAVQSMKFLHIPDTINLVLWCVGLLTLITVFIVYSLKCIFYFEAVRREYYHPVRVNFFFAPWIGCMFVSLGVPPHISKTLHPAIWCVCMFPILCLELKIYGQWMSGGERRLSKVANPSNHLAIVGNFVGALLGAATGWKEGAIFFFAVGLAHYLVLFVTLYQRLPTNETLPHDLHPVFFLFVAAPSVASLAWEKINGKFDNVSRTAYFIALFLYASLVVRLNFFRGFKFSVAWWAYTFPMTGAAIATIKYSNTVTHPITQGLAVVLSIVASLIVFSLFVTTILHAFVWGTLFPNDVSIAITTKKRKTKRKKKSAGKKMQEMLRKFAST